MKILQLNEYDMRRTFKHFAMSYMWWAFLIGAGFFILIYFFTMCMKINFYPISCAYILLACFIFLLFFCFLDGGVETPKMTKRIWRLILLSSVLEIGIFTTACLCLQNNPEWLYAIPTLMPLVGYFLVYLCNLVLLPVESVIKTYYIHKAKEKLEQNDLLVIGVTGSFGKTSTKNFLDVILSEKFIVLATPKNYNTPMGVTKTVLKNMTVNQEIFIVEMGAYKCGDIAEICDLVLPKMGVLVSVGAQHLNSFKTIENIRDTKNELIESLPADGIAFFNIDNDYCRESFDKCKVEKISVSINDSKATIFAKNLRMTDSGMSFEVILNGEVVSFNVCILGVHNVTNLLLAIAVAQKLGLTTTQIRRGVAKIRAVPHRLELKHLETGDLLLDDAYNSNINGFKNALQVLSGYDLRKIVITPGIIDLGEKSMEINTQIGNEIGKVADEVIIVKKTNRVALMAGLLASGFDEEHIYYADNFKDAQKKYSQFLNGKSVILLENDLPDNYE